jgi:atypical dual specificity phosphatase
LLETAFRLYAADLYRSILSKVGQVVVAEDLTSTVFLKAVRWVEPGRSLKSVRGWLYATARTTIADYWHTHQQLEVLPLEKAEALDVQCSTEHETETRTRQRVQQLLALLPPREREILRLRYLHGYSSVEIAQVLGVKAGHVRVLQLRALRLASQGKDNERERKMTLSRPSKNVPTGTEYTEQVSNALQFAREEARSMSHGFVGTEHVLLGLLREGSVTPLLEQLGVDLVRARGGIAFLRGGKPLPGKHPGEEPGFTRHVQKVLEQAECEARRMGEALVRPQHLLLGLLLRTECVAGDLLRAMDVDVETVREALMHPEQPAVLLLTCSFCHHKHAQVFSSSTGTALPAVLSERVSICWECLERFYELLKTKQAEAGLAHFRWQLSGKLAGVSFPHSLQALAFLKEEGINAIVSLSETPPPPDLLARLGLQAAHVPLADCAAPTISQVEQAIGCINRFLEHTLSVAVHCGAGLGRTGTILACYLVWQGASAQNALLYVRQREAGSVETAEQEAIIAQYERHLRVIPSDQEI